MVESPTSSPPKDSSDGEQGGSPSKKGNKEEYHFPDGVTVPPTVDASLVTGDMVDMLNELSVEKINAALDTYDSQFKMRGDDIRSPRNYLRGILKGLTGRRFEGLPSGVMMPNSITQSMLDEGDLLEVLKSMSVRDINSCFRDFDEQVKKKSSDIRNKNAYLMGIIKSGPHYNLPQGVILPSSISLAMLKGEVLETLQQLPAVNINSAFAEYDDMIQRRSDSIRNRAGYLLGIVRRVKKTFDEEAAEHVAKSPPKNTAVQSTSPSKNGSVKSPSTPETPKTHAKSNGSGGGEEQPSPSSDTFYMVTEGFVKVTNELVVERQARNTLEDKVKQSETKREETNQRILKLMSLLEVEKETRERSALEVQRLRKDLAFERSLREAAEEKVQLLEESRDQLQKGSNNSNTEHEQVQKLQLDLSIERGLREKTEKLLRTAEGRLDELNKEMQYLEGKLQEERTKSPFATWMVDGDDKKTAENGAQTP